MYCVYIMLTVHMYIYSSLYVLHRYYASFFTGWVVAYAMFVIYTGASDEVKAAKYEIFYSCHMAFIVFYLFFWIHGPNTFFWTIFPCLLYAYDR